MAAVRFDVYGRYELDVERCDAGWKAYIRGEGKRREHPTLFIPSDVGVDDIAGYLEDLLHEEGTPATAIRRLR